MKQEYIRSHEEKMKGKEGRLQAWIEAEHTRVLPEPPQALETAWQKQIHIWIGYNAETKVWEDLDNVSKRPFELFKKWIKEACIYRPEHMKEEDPLYLCRTCEDLHEPLNSYLILKGYDEQAGFVWYTKYKSNKGRKLKATKAK